jgi:hypothetical protein
VPLVTVTPTPKPSGTVQGPRVTLVPFPLPVRYYLRFGEPLRLTGSPNDEDSELERKVKVVKGAIQSMINRALRERKRVFF